MFHQHKCDRCDNRATIHMTEIKGGQKNVTHLCEPCHKAEEGNAGMPALAFDPSKMVASGTRGGGKGPTCPRCGLTYADFKQHGRFGCEHDYEVFGQELKALFKRIHNDIRYTGKRPGGGKIEAGPSEDVLRERRRALKLAIEEERYEEAASLRDEIRRLESPDAEAAASPATEGPDDAGAPVGDPPAEDAGSDDPPGTWA